MSSVATATIGSAEKELARSYIAQVRSLILGATQGLTKEQWDFRPAEGAWSIAQTLEHVVMVQGFITARIADLMEGKIGMPAAADRDHAALDEIALYRFSARLAKFKGPDFAQPPGKMGPLEALETFGQNCDALEALLDAPGELRGAVLDSPPMKAISGGKYDTMDAYQWLLAVASHTERHAKQMVEVRGHREFPA